MQSGFSTSLLSRLLLDVTVRAGQIGGFISRNRMYLQTVAGAIALALGFWGWMIEKPPADFRGMLDNVFRTVQLITLQFPTDLNSSPNYQLQIARLAVPVVAILATFQVLIASITRPARLALLPYTSGHIVVCGSAQITQSALKTLTSRRQQVVVVGSDAGDRDVLEGFGITVLEGDPLQEATLRSVDLSRAAACLVLGDDDVENLNIAMQALPALDERPQAFPPLILAVRIDNEQLAVELDYALDNLSRRHGVRYHRLSPAREGVRMELSRFAPALLKVDKATRTHVLVVGLGQDWEAIAMQIVMAMQDDPERSPMLSFIVSNKEAERIKRWRKTKPELDLIVEIAVLVCEEDEALPSADKIEPWRKTCSAPQVAIVLRDDADAITATLALRRPGNPLRTDSIPVLVHQSQEDRLLARLGTAQVEYRDLTRLIPIGGLLRAESLERVLDRKGDEIAIALHSGYLGAAETVRDESAAALRPWDDLPQNLRDANRAAAEHAPLMLAAIGRALAPIASDADPAPLSNDEMEILTKIEHRRWIAERIAHGWRYGPMRDDRQMLHPDMVPYESLSNAAKEKDRNAVRVLLSALEAQGQVLVARVSRPTT
jgi:hypothetical protein